MPTAGGFTGRLLPSFDQAPSRPTLLLKLSGLPPSLPLPTNLSVQEPPSLPCKSEGARLAGSGERDISQVFGVEVVPARDGTALDHEGQPDARGAERALVADLNGVGPRPGPATYLAPGDKYCGQGLAAELSRQPHSGFRQVAFSKPQSQRGYQEEYSRARLHMVGKYYPPII